MLLELVQESWVCQFLWNNHNVDMPSTLIQSHFQCHCMLLSPSLMLVFQTLSTIALGWLMLRPITLNTKQEWWNLSSTHCVMLAGYVELGTDSNFIQMTFSQGSTWISLSYICKLELSCYHAKWMLANWFLKRLNKLSDWIPMCYPTQQ